MSGAIKINGTSSGSTTITAPASGGDESIELSTVLAGKANTADIVAPGLVLITPTSIAYSGGSASSSGGTTTFTGVSSISLNGVFTSSYDYYQIFLSSLTGSGTPSFRFRLSGSDDSSANYNQRTTSISDSTFAASRTNAGTSASLAAGLSGAPSHIFCRIIDPALAKASMFWNEMQTIYSASSNGANYGLGGHLVTTAYDGITFLSTSMTGTIRVYGYQGA